VHSLHDNLYTRCSDTMMSVARIVVTFPPGAPYGSGAVMRRDSYADFGSI